MTHITTIRRKEKSPQQRHLRLAETFIGELKNLSSPIFSINVVPEQRCYRFEPFMFSVRYSY